MPNTRDYRYEDSLGAAVEYHPVEGWRRVSDRVRVSVFDVTRREIARSVRVVDEEDTSVSSQVCSCEACKVARFEDSPLRGSVVHSYNYKPAKWSLKSVKDDPYSYYLGVELETDSERPATKRASINRFNEVTRSTIRSSFTNEQAAGMRLPKNLWVAKRDGSVSGPEFASHPATLTYWRKQKPKLETMFKTLLHAGFRSHDNDKCGMHINISRSAFDSPRHLFRFLTLVHSNVGWTTKMSQRTRRSAEQWASLSDFKDRGFRKATSRNLMKRNSRGQIDQFASTGNKYCAFNAPYAEHRFEFRIPRGTLRIDRFFKNLEWVTAMIEFTRNGLVIESRPKNFMAWVMERKQEFPHLADFLVERKMVVVE